MQSERLPSEDEMGRLKRELNFLLWTDDVPEVPADAPSVLPPGAAMEPVTVNIQCGAHTIVTAGLLMRRGFEVTTRSGMAFVIEAGPGGAGGNKKLNQIARHWWLTLGAYGVVDLSLHGDAEAPLVYCNRSPGGRWSVGFGDNPERLDRFLRAKRQGCFYFTGKKRRVAEADLAEELRGSFPPAKRIGIPVSFGAILGHCERFLAGSSGSLCGVAQREAWERLAR